MGKAAGEDREWVVRFGPAPFIVAAFAIVTTAVLRSWSLLMVWVVVVALVVGASWRPFRLATTTAGAQIEYFQAGRWNRLVRSEIAALRYEHGQLDGRGRALIRADLVGGRTVRIPGTAGTSWFRRAPEISGAEIPKKRLHLVSTTNMLALVGQRLSLQVDTYDAVGMNPRR
ncbi:MAG: hypothetical protein ACKO5A_07905 [Actinomycetota bacterium]